MNKGWTETLKEGLRIGLFAAITALVGWATQYVSGFDPNSIYYIIGTVILRLADKWVHENKDIKAQGIAPF